MNFPKISSILKGIIKGLISHQSEVSKSPGISFDDPGSGSYDKHYPSVINSIYDSVMDSIEKTKNDKPEEIKLEKPKITYGSDTKIN